MPLPHLLRHVALFVSTILAGSALAAGVPVPEPPPARDPPQFELVAYGLFPELAEVGRKKAKGSSSGTIGVISEYDEAQPSETTDRVVAQIGVRFGYTFRVTNRGTYDSVPVRIRVTHPPLTLPDGTQQNVDTWRAEAQGLPRLTGWRYEQDYELVAGDWTIAVICDGRVALEKTFHVVHPTR